MYLFYRSILTGKPYPYWFGKTNLACAIRFGKGRRKRGAVPHRYEHSLTHRWIEYRGHYFEFLGPGHLRASSSAPYAAGSCSQRREGRVAGYGVLSVDCLERCTRSYEDRFGGYSWIPNNCHRFANRISKLLCQESSCPSWCNWRCCSY